MSQNEGGGDASPDPPAKQEGPDNNSGGNKWIAPAIFAFLTTVAIVIPGLNGAWHEIWVKWGLVPAAIIAGTMGVYEVCKLGFSIKTKPSIAISGVAFVISGAFAIFMYAEYPSGWEPPLIPEGTTYITIIFGNESESAGSAAVQVPIAECVKEPMSPIKITAMDLVKVQVKHNRLFVQARLPTELNAKPFHQILGTNHIFAFSGDNGSNLKLPYTWDSNSTSNAFEIVDNDDLPLLQLYYRRGDVVVIRGIFVNDNNNGGVVLFGRPHYYAGMVPTNTPDGTVRKPMFKYPSSLHQGELAD